MSVIKSTAAGLHQFHRSAPMPCPYLPDRVERKLFTRLAGDDAAALNSLLTRAGFRRSHDVLYRPVCSGCDACVPVRIPVGRFAPSRSMRRCIAANGDLAVVERPARATEELYRLFLAYEQSRHADSDMARMTTADFATMIEEGAAAAILLEFRRSDGGLEGAILVDRLDDGYSAIYSFFDPSSPERGTGTFMILALAERAREKGLAHVYLGYWIGESRKMAYKARFRPLEALTANGWRTLSPDEDGI